MQQSRQYGILCISFLSMCLASGCMMQHADCGIPLGQWEGSGTFLHKDLKDKPENAKKIPDHFCYPTELTISREINEGHEIVKFAVTSHSNLAGHSDEVHIEFDLSDPQIVARTAWSGSNIRNPKTKTRPPVA